MLNFKNILNSSFKYNDIEWNVWVLLFIKTNYVRFYASDKKEIFQIT